MLQAVHKASQSVKDVVGGDCPVFQRACPFKNCMTSMGTPLVLELESRSWGLMVPDSSPWAAQDDPSTSLPPPLELPLSAAATAEATVEAPVAATEAADDGEGLARKLKEGTKDAHKAAETVHFVHEFIKGHVTWEVYAQFVVNLYHIYRALEEALDSNEEHPLVDSLYFPEELQRTQSLREDAEFFHGPDWEMKTAPSEVTCEYVERLRRVGKEFPELLAPHAYTRYLGDLSGGQVLKRAAVRGLKLVDDGNGVKFYTFSRIRDPKAFKNMYRARLDSLSADGPTADAMVEEANYAFSLNTRIFKELDAMSGFFGEVQPAMAPKAKTSGANAAPVVATAAVKAAAAACPFAALAAAGAAMPEGHPAIAHGGGTATVAKAKPEDPSPVPGPGLGRRAWALAVVMALLAVLAALSLSARA